MADLPQDPFNALVPEFDKEPLSFDNTFVTLETGLDLMPKGHSDAYIQKRAQELALISRALDNTADATMSYDMAKERLTFSPDVNLTMQADQTLYARKLTEAVRGKAALMAVEDPESAEFYQRLEENMDSVSTMYDGLSGRQKILADAYASETPLSRSVREQETKGYAFALFEEWAEERNVLDKIIDVGGLFQPLSFTLDANELAVRLDPDYKGDAIDNFTRTIAGYQVLDPELKREILPELIDQAAEAYDNNEFKLGAFVALLHDPDYFTESYATGALEAVETGTLLASAPITGAMKAAKAIQKGGLRQLLKGYGNNKEAVEATKAGRSPVDEAMDADPTNWENTIIGTNATDGLSPVYQKMVDDIKREVAEPVAKMADDDSIIKVEALRPAEKEAAKKNYVDTLRSDKHPDILSAEVISEDAKGFKVRYQIDNGEDGVLIMQRDVDWSVDDVGSLIAKDEAAAKQTGAVLGSKILSPDTLFAKFDSQLVPDITFGGMQSSIVRKELTKAWQATDKGLAKDSKRVVDELLIVGDEWVDDTGKLTGRVFTPGELLSGTVETISGKRPLTMPEVKAYYAKRAFFDEAWRLQNKISREKLKFQGMKEATWINPHTGIEEIQIAKPFKDGRGWANDIREDILAPGLMNDTQSVFKRGVIDVKAAIEAGFTPVKFMNPIKVGDTTVNYGLIPRAGKQGINELPDKVLNYHTGYVTKHSQPGLYYVKDANDGNRTVAKHKTVQEAKAWMAEQHARAAQTPNPANNSPNLFAHRDRDFNAIDLISEEANSYGGLYTGSRSSVGIFEGSELAGEMSRLSVGQSVQRMVESISTQMPLNEYRVAVTKRFKETVLEALKREGKENTELARMMNTPDQWQTAPLNAILDNDLRSVLEANRRYIIDSLKIPSNQENLWSHYMMNIADMLPNSKVRDMTVKIATSNPMQAMKGATFDAYLGWFNPRQLYIQASNASLAMSMYPKQALGAIKTAFVQRTMLYTPTIDRELLARAAKGIDVDVDDMVVSMEQYKSSGLRESVMRTGDYEANLGGFTQGTIEGYRKLASSGRIFFEEGEAMARLISWNIARNNWKAANPGKAIGKAEIREIADDVLRMNLNMQRENASWWQKNPLTSVPTQFLQVQAKLAENIIGGIMGNGRWTRKEAGAVFFGQMALYGTGGVYLADEMTGFLKEKVSGTELEFARNNPKWNKALDQGMMGVFAGTLGLNNNFSEPANILSGFDDNIIVDGAKSIGAMISRESNEIAFQAPVVGVAQRTGDAMAKIYQATLDIVHAPSIETVGDSIFKSVDGIASITSTWSNARKVIFLHRLGGIPDSRGNIAISLENLEGENLQSLLAKAWGIPLDYEGAYYKMKQDSFDHKKMEQDTKKALRKIYLEYKMDGNFEKFRANKALILGEYDPRSKQHQDITNSFIDSVSKNRSGVDRELSNWMSNYIRTGGAIGAPAYLNTLQNSEE